jgi:hypothetical protein
MNRRLTRSLIATILGTGLVLTSGAAVTASADTPTLKITPVISGLNGPRGIAFDSHSNLYVAEAGAFQNVTGMNFAVNQTGKVDKFKVDEGTATLKWSTSFNSLSDTFLGGGPEVLGPAGVATDGNHVLALLSQNSTGVHKLDPTLDIPQIGHLFSLNAGNGHAESISNIGDQEYEWAADNAGLWKEFPDSNPNAVLITEGRNGHRDRTFVVDSGANTVAEVMPNGKIHVIAFIPNDPVRDSTPTCITQGPDGALYVATLDLVENLFTPLGPGASHVYRIDPNTHESFLTAAHVWASGLTTVFGCTFDRHGNFWATEILAPNKSGPPGDVARIPFSNPSSIEHIGLGSLPTPGGIAEGPDHAIYVAVGAAITAPNAGGIVKITS